VPAGGGAARLLLDLDGSQAGAAHSPDGEWIAFDSDDTGDGEVALVHVDGSGMIVLTDDPGWDSAPAWSPDGERIAFASDRTGDSELWVMAADGSDQQNLTRNPGAHDGWAGSSWSDDGELIASNSSGFTPFWAEPFVREALGVAGLLVQAALIAGFALTALRHGPLPFGSLTLLVGVSGSLMTVISDQYRYIAVAFLSGLAADLLVLLLKPSAVRPLALRITTFALPAIWYALYLASLGLFGEGIGWSIHMTLGGPVLAGIVGLLLGFLAFPGTTATEPAST
jgi:TolB protein